MSKLESHTLLGYFEPDGVPVILDNSSTSTFTQIHERTHAYDLNSSIFGATLRDLLKSKKSQEYK